MDSGHHFHSIRKLDTAEDRPDRRTEVEDFLILLVEQILRTNINLYVLGDVVVRNQIPHIEGPERLLVVDIFEPRADVATFQTHPQRIDRLVAEDETPLINRHPRHAVARLLRKIACQRIGVLSLYIQALDPGQISHKPIFDACFPSLGGDKTDILGTEIGAERPNPATSRTLLADNQVSKPIPEIRRTESQPVIEQILVHSNIHTLAFFWLEIRLSKIWEKQLIDGGSPEPRRVTATDLRPSFLMKVAGGRAISGGTPEYVVIILPNSTSRKDSIPQVELCLIKPGIAGNDSVADVRGSRTEIDVFALLFSELVSRGEQLGFSDLEVMLPFDAICQGVDLRASAERRGYGAGQDVSLRRSRVCIQGLCLARHGEHLVPPIRDWLLV